MSFFVLAKHLPKVIDDISQAISVNNQGKGFGQDDNGHIPLEAHLGQSCQHAEKISWTNWPNHHKDKETVKAIALIQPTDIFVIGALADHRLDKGRSVETNQVKDNGTTNDNTDIVVDGPDDMPIDKDTCNGGKSTWNDRNNRLQNL